MEGYFFVWLMMDAKLSLATSIKSPDCATSYVAQHEPRTERYLIIIGQPQRLLEYF